MRIEDDVAIADKNYDWNETCRKEALMIKKREEIVLIK
jgi:hypothetical protein